MPSRSPVYLDGVQAFAPGDPRPDGYSEWYEWATVQHRAGLRQTRCPVCGLWRWPSERGVNMANRDEPTDFQLWRMNLKWRRLCHAGEIPDRNLGWRDLRFCVFRFWPLVITSLLHRRPVPGAMVVIGAPLTRKCIERTRQVMAGLGYAERCGHGDP